MYQGLSPEEIRNLAYQLIIAIANSWVENKRATSKLVLIGSLDFKLYRKKKVLLLTLGCSSLSKLTLNDYNEIMALFKAGIANM